MKSLGSWLFVALGLALGFFASNIALFGAEPALPRASAAIEGEVMPGETLRSPVGDPFLYGEVRIQDADNTQANVGTIHWRGSFGNPVVRIRTQAGEETVRLPNPSRWRVLEEDADSREVASVNGLPIVSEVTIGERLSPPFRLSVRAIRPGDHVVVARDSSLRVPVYLGSRADHETGRRQREAGRWPIVAVLAILALSSLFLAFRLRKGITLEPIDDDSDEAKVSR